MLPIINAQTFLDMFAGLYNEPFKLGVRERMENCKNKHAKKKNNKNNTKIIKNKKKN